MTRAQSLLSGNDVNQSVFLDSEKLCVVRDGKQIPLSKKAHALLCVLRDNPQRLMSQDDLLDAVWPNTYVQPEIVKTYIKEIRLALGDDAKRPRFIETRRGCGYRFVGNVQASQAASGGAHFVGRAEEIARLQSAFEESTRGQRRFVFITGEAGIGKSALLDEFEARFQRGTDIMIARGHCQPHLPFHEPYYPFFEIFSHLRGESNESQSAAEAGSVDYVAPCLFAPKRSSGASTLAVPLAWGVQEWCEFLETASRRKPLLLIIEDLQWADQGTLALLGALARRRSSASLSVFASYRAIEIASGNDPVRSMMIDLVLHCRAIEVALPGLSLDELSSYVRRRVNEPIDPDKENMIAEQSGGNPFLVEAIVATMLDSARQSPPLTGFILPPRSDLGRRVEFMLEAQLAQFGQRVRHVIEAASVSGKYFCSWSVAQLLDCNVGYVEDVCDRLVRSNQLLTNSGCYELPDGTTSPRFRFKHQLLHELLIGRLSRTRLAALQGQLGIKIEKFWGHDVRLVASDITHRFELAGDWPRAISYAKIAAVEARGHANAADTIRMASKAMQLAAYLPPKQREREVRMIGHEFGLNKPERQSRRRQVNSV